MQALPSSTWFACDGSCANHRQIIPMTMLNKPARKHVRKPQPIMCVQAGRMHAVTGMRSLAALKVLR